MVHFYVATPTAMSGNIRLSQRFVDILDGVCKQWIGLMNFCVILIKSLLKIEIYFKF